MLLTQVTEGETEARRTQVCYWNSQVSEWQSQGLSGVQRSWSCSILSPKPNSRAHTAWITFALPVPGTRPQGPWRLMGHIPLLTAQPRARPCPREVASIKAIFTQVPGVLGRRSGLRGWAHSHKEEVHYKERARLVTRCAAPKRQTSSETANVGEGLLRTEAGQLLYKPFIRFSQTSSPTRTASATLPVPPAGRICQGDQPLIRIC